MTGGIAVESHDKAALGIDQEFAALKIDLRAGRCRADNDATLHHLTFEPKRGHHGGDGRGKAQSKTCGGKGEERAQAHKA